MSPDAYELHEGKFVQVRTSISAANALNVFSGPVPSGKIWTILSGRILVSISETRYFWWQIWSGAIGAFPITRPVSQLVDTVMFFPLVTEGMEIKVFPGEYIAAYRDIATAGSTIALGIRLIETDLPYYSYEEPLKKVIRPSPRRGSSFQNVIASAGVNGSGGGEIPGGGGGGGGEPQPY